jgi:hypothetical protein
MLVNSYWLPFYCFLPALRKIPELFTLAFKFICNLVKPSLPLSPAFPFPMNLMLLLQGSFHVTRIFLAFSRIYSYVIVFYLVNLSSPMSSPWLYLSCSHSISLQKLLVIFKFPFSSRRRAGLLLPNPFEFIHGSLCILVNGIWTEVTYITSI